VRRRKRHPVRVAESLVGTAGRYLGMYGTVVKLAQLAPVAVGLAIVFFSPSAWLSGTLRQWALAGVIAGGVAGAAALARIGLRSEQQDDFASGLLLLAIVAAAALRFHLALADLGFLARWPLLQPLHDFYLGSDLGERLYNGATAIGFASTLFLATLGLPLFVRGRAARRRAESELPVAAVAARAKEAFTALTGALEALERTNEALRRENQDLTAELAARNEGGTGGRRKTDASEPDPAPRRP
jgi:hypothetical protein